MHACTGQQLLASSGGGGGGVAGPQATGEPAAALGVSKGGVPLSEGGVPPLPAAGLGGMPSASASPSNSGGGGFAEGGAGQPVQLMAVAELERRYVGGADVRGLIRLFVARVQRQCVDCLPGLVEGLGSPACLAAVGLVLVLVVVLWVLYYVC